MSNFFLKKIYEIGAGHIGNYKECSFQNKGKGTYIPIENSNPLIGNINKKEIRYVRWEFLLSSGFI